LGTKYKITAKTDQLLFLPKLENSLTRDPEKESKKGLSTDKI
jgi:hypothetical protein